MSDLSGTYLGPYYLVELVSYGGTAAVYKARQPSLDRMVAIKVMYHAPDPQFASRFKREAQVIAQLQHPNILPIYDYGEHQGTLFLALRYIEGGTTLHDCLGKPIEPLHAMRLIVRLLAALEYAHARGIVHRDVKPANVLLPAPDWPMLADFGIVKLASDDQRLTSTGLIIGTAAYMSPEQALGERVDARSDIYSVGVVLYEMLTGRVPFEAANAMGVLNKHVHTQPPAPRQLNPNLPPVVEALLLRSLAKQPEARFQTAAEMAEALRHAISQLEGSQNVPVAQSEAKVYPSSTRSSNARWRWASLAAVTVLLGGSGLGWIGSRNVAAQSDSTPTVAIAATSSPTATSTPSATPSVTPSATATATSTVTPSATATESPTATATDAPTATATSVPTAKPLVKATPKPTIQPKAKPVVQPTAVRPAAIPPTDVPPPPAPQHVEPTPQPVVPTAAPVVPTAEPTEEPHKDKGHDTPKPTKVAEPPKAPEPTKAPAEPTPPKKEPKPPK